MAMRTGALLHLVAPHSNKPHLIWTAFLTRTEQWCPASTIKHELWVFTVIRATPYRVGYWERVCNQESVKQVCLKGVHNETENELTDRADLLVFFKYLAIPIGNISDVESTI